MSDEERVTEFVEKTGWKEEEHDENAEPTSHLPWVFLMGGKFSEKKTPINIIN